ncbi:hypothetical protein RQP54_00550 [Curvibacter sp. APW13]|uniref:hypothetical protein n=1 Tax=Curvibacter sp. APW13 TaxID=3077236 RepID=UPI0028DE3141|nr:hypothetical protein [Curvibacter sp. APW13]MDT8989344.1 hypothetical protein [Curvibacter sp. APW13]
MAAVSLDAAPPLDVPLRFLLTAPLFSALVGVLMLFQGPFLWTSQWTPGALGVTHLMTLGLMLFSIVGALLQMLPVMLGVGVAQPRLVAGAVQSGVVGGLLCLESAFLWRVEGGFGGAAVLLGTAIGVFVLACGHALWHVPRGSATATGLRWALVGLVAAIVLGASMALGLEGWLPLPLSLPRLVTMHLAWGLLGWNLVVLASVALVVVPMFQVTPAYPRWFAVGFPGATVVLLLAWSLAEWQRWSILSDVLGVAVAMVAVCFALVTLRLHWRSRRAMADAITRHWWVGLGSMVSAALVWALGRVAPQWLQWTEWPVLVGTLLLFGGFLSVLTGMFYRIVPFLVWMHLQDLGQGRLLAPNVRKLLPQDRIEAQTRAHWVSLALLVGAACWPTVLAYPAGAALLVSQLWLAHNLWGVVPLYRAHCARLDALEAKTPLATGLS